jgi:hypothetical protein
MTALVDKMKISSSGGEMYYGFTQQIHGGVPDDGHELMIARLETTGSELTNILRWEDDGGQMVVLNRQAELLNPMN